MNKICKISLMIPLFIFLLVITSCEDNDMSEMFYNGYKYDDEVTLQNGITVEYDIDDLTSFFVGRNSNEIIGFGMETSSLTFNEVNNRFPVQIIRSTKYTVYKVKQGGYFYVFWNVPYDMDKDEEFGEPIVFFSTYLSSEKSIYSFESLIPLVSSAKDVKKIDSSFELSFLMSNGIYSYSYLNDENLMRIKYKRQANINGYEDLIVEEMTIIPRSDAPCRISLILKSDIPDTVDGSLSPGQSQQK